MPRVLRRATRVGRDRISIRIVRPPEARPVRGSVIVPPLIGGSGMQQVDYFRELNRAGYRLVTFDYRGHGKSGGRFCVQKTIEDARAVLAAVPPDLGREPVFGVADCYGCLPLLLAASSRPGVLSALALFNPIPSLQQVARPRDVLANYFLPRDGAGRRRLAWRNPLDLGGMLLATCERLFPGVDKSREHFGILRYERAHAWRATWEYLVARPLAGLVCDIPALICCGRSDRLLGLQDAAAEQRYLASWRRHLPRAEVRVLADVDHFWSGARSRANALAAAFFEAVSPGEPRSARYREPGEAAERNHQLTGCTASSGLKCSASR